MGHQPWRQHKIKFKLMHAYSPDSVTHTCSCMLRSCLFRERVVVASGLTAHNTDNHALHSRSRQMDRGECRQALKHMHLGNTGGTYLLQGHVHRPQNCPRLFRFFSASIMSLLIWSIPSSMRSSCSDYQHIVIYPSKRTKAREKRRQEKKVVGW